MIVGDWGNTQLRLWTLEGAQNGHAPRLGRGVGQMERKELQGHLRQTLGDWLALAQSDGVLLCGAAGSNIGLFEVDYLACPADLDGIESAILTQTLADIAISILPGLASQNAFGNPDRLRGEETQILGAQRLGQVPQNALVCLPGTHPKWVQISDGRVTGFTSTLTGEVFQILSNHSILVPNTPQVHENTGAFMQGVERALTCGSQTLLSDLFSIRASQIAGEFDPTCASEHLSGLLIGADISLAVQTFSAAPSDEPTFLIGGESLCKRYATALSAMGKVSNHINGDAMAVAGLSYVASLLG
ncbi:MAG: 2-dehydro-3-deoxygalactonokinase [Pseudomonadota bacterium]